MLLRLVANAIDDEIPLGPVPTAGETCHCTVGCYAIYVLDAIFLFHSRNALSFTVPLPTFR